MREHFRSILSAGLMLSCSLPMLGWAQQSLDQGWNPQQFDTWFHIDQGSRVVPESWIKALEQPDSQAPFLQKDFLEKTLHLPSSSISAEGLANPVGFVTDQQSDLFLSHTKLRWKKPQSDREKWWGPTCAACHTSKISYQGNSFFVPGGQTMADLQSVLAELNLALAQTYEQPDKFSRFASKVLGAENTEENQQMLRQALHRLRFDSNNHLYSEHMTDLQFGPGRLDAVGYIYDHVSRINGGSHEVRNETDAPVNYPFLWNVPKLDRVQWTGFVPNAKFLGFDLGAMIRNIGEVIGVFADVPTPLPADNLLTGYASSVRAGNLVRIEDMLGKLRPPAWPNSLFGTPNPDLVAQGRSLYEKNCASCHQMHDRRDLLTPITTHMTRLFPNGVKELLGTKPLGTDPWTACNGYQATAPSGYFLGMPSVPGYTIGYGLMGPWAHSLDMTAWTALGIAERDAVAIGIDGALQATIGGAWFGNSWLPIGQIPRILLNPTQPHDLIVGPASKDKQKRLAACRKLDGSLLAYKARSLNGIWATAPYLHNGSVPTLYDLLLPPDQRPKTFYTGSIEFDPVKVGYVTAPNSQNDFLLDTRIPGNSNAGHDYGNDTFTEQDRKALVEYMKTL